MKQNDAVFEALRQIAKMGTRGSITTPSGETFLIEGVKIGKITDALAANDVVRDDMHDGEVGSETYKLTITNEKSGKVEIEKPGLAGGICFSNFAAAPGNLNIGVCFSAFGHLTSLVNIVIQTPRLYNKHIKTRKEIWDTVVGASKATKVDIDWIKEDFPV